VVRERLYVWHVVTLKIFPEECGDSRSLLSLWDVVTLKVSTSYFFDLRFLIQTVEPNARVEPSVRLNPRNLFPREFFRNPTTIRALAKVGSHGSRGKCCRVYQVVCFGTLE